MAPVPMTSLTGNGYSSINLETTCLFLVQIHLIWSLNDLIEKQAFSSIFFSSYPEFRLDNKKNIKLCIDPDWMPLEAIHNGRHVGMTADFMRIFESSLGIPINLVPTQSWTQSLEYIRQQRCDILSLAMDTPERRRYLDFTHPYFRMPVVIATTNDKFFISDLNSIKDKKIGIVKGYAFEEILLRDYQWLLWKMAWNVSTRVSYTLLLVV